MLKSDNLIVAFRDETVVWRWRNPAPIEFLFMNRQAASFFTKYGSVITSWQVKAPYGAMAIATGILTDPKPLDALATLTKAGTLTETIQAGMPVWISELDLERMTLTDAQQALLGTEATPSDQSFTLEI